MKKTLYERPDMEKYIFDNKDVITTSGGELNLDDTGSGADMNGSVFEWQ